MENKKKIGLITIYHVPNYGSVLQAYATQCIFEKFGVECVMLNYKYPNEWHSKQTSNIKLSLRAKVSSWLPITPSHRKQKKLQKFRKEKYHFSKLYANLDDFRKEDWSNYDAFCVGSDQVWNPRYTLGDSAFMLSFIPDEKYKFSLASSIAQNHMPHEYIDKYKKYICRLDAISVREYNSKIVIHEDLDIHKHVEVVLDPTLLLDNEEWIKLCTNHSLAPQKTKRYILLYLLAYAFEPRPYVFDVIRHFKKEYDCEVVVLEGYSGIQKNLGFDIINRRTSSISEFISLFANSEMVITTSFHGSAFALNFGKPLISIIPDNKGDDRQAFLLNSLGLSNCIVTLGTEVRDINPFYDVAAEQKKLDLLRKESLNWLGEIINNIQK